MVRTTSLNRFEISTEHRQGYYWAKVTQNSRNSIIKSKKKEKFANCIVEAKDRSSIKA